MEWIILFDLVGITVSERVVAESSILVAALEACYAGAVEECVIHDGIDVDGCYFLESAAIHESTGIYRLYSRGKAELCDLTAVHECRFTYIFYAVVQRDGSGVAAIIKCKVGYVPEITSVNCNAGYIGTVIECCLSYVANITKVY